MDKHCSECGETIADTDNDAVVCNDDTIVCGACAVDMTADELERN